MNFESKLTLIKADASFRKFYRKKIKKKSSIIIYSEKENDLIELFEMYEKEKMEYINVFYRIPPDREKIRQTKLAMPDVTCSSCGKTMKKPNFIKYNHTL